MGTEGQENAQNEANVVWQLIAQLDQTADVTDILINGPEQIFVERQGRLVQIKGNLPLASVHEFIHQVAKFNGKTLDEQSPFFDGLLPDGARINVVMAPVIWGGHPAISIRKFMKKIQSFQQAPHIFGVGPKMVCFLQALVRAKCNIVVAGGSGAGKTTMMNLLLHELHPTERAIIIEDTIELNCMLPNLVRMEVVQRANGYWGPRELIRNALRMRPDRIIIGESRGAEFFDLLAAMNTGHQGSMTTIHANSARECLSRMENLMLLSPVPVPLTAIRRQIASGINFIIHLVRGPSGQRKMEQLIEVTGQEGDVINTQQLALNSHGQLEFTGLVPNLMGQLQQVGGLPANFFQDLGRR